MGFFLKNLLQLVYHRYMLWLSGTAFPYRKIHGPGMISRLGQYSPYAGTVREVHHFMKTTREIIMEKFVYYAPTEIVFGRETELKTADLVKKYGGSRVFVIYGGSSAKKSGLLDRVMQNLKENGLAAEAMGGVVPNPLVSTAREMVKAALAFQADFILAVGGGSVIDTAKGVAHAVADPSHDIWDFWTGTKVTKSLPVGTILTISAAGSETSNSSVLTNDTKVPPTKRGP